MRRAAVSLAFVGLVGITVLWVQSLRQLKVVQPGQSLPSIVYLGDSGTFTIDPGYEFIVKRRTPLSIHLFPGPTYTAGPEERVYSVIGAEGEPPALYRQTADIGLVEAGCTVQYVAIDDDVDDRINTFFLNGVMVHTMPQAPDLVMYDSFVVPSDGMLSLEARDSIGMYINLCLPQTPTPSSSPTPTDSATITITPSNTPTLTATPTGSATLTPSPTGSPSPTPTGSATITPTPPTTTPTPTGSATITPTPTTTTPTLTPTTATGTPTLTPTTTTETATPTATTTTITPTKPPLLPSCLRINFEVGGDEARRGLYVVREIGGRKLVEWYALEGWKDSGWFTDIDIPYPSVYVEVLYYPGPETTPVRMKILNPAPGTEYGWLSRGSCHALEVAWPDETGD